MYEKHRRTSRVKPVLRVAAILVLALVVSFSSISTVTANTVFANVVDGNESYSFSMSTPDLDDILEEAGLMGLEPLGELDVAEQIDGTTTVIIRRGIKLTITDGGKSSEVVAYLGDSVERTLERNNILVLSGDSVSPQTDTMVYEGMNIQIDRECSVQVIADGETHRVSLVNATVRDAIEAAGVSVGSTDAVNYGLDDSLYDEMKIRVVRTADISVTVDGVTNDYTVSAVTVSEALKNCGVVLGDEDRLNVSRTEVPKSGMEIVVTRIITKELTETEELPYESETIETDELYEGESEVTTQGVNGERKVTYSVTYADGELESKTVLSEEVTLEPVNEVISVGTRQAEQDEEDYEDDSSSSSAGSYSDAAGTFVDSYGNTVSYSKVLTGTCTAYYPINATTSTGAAAGRGAIAVDPSVIPYGTKLYVTSADGSIVYGYGYACDTGGAVMSGEVLADLCYDTVEECSIIGRRDMVIYILD